MEWNSLFYNAGSFITALFVLEYGADKFVDETAALSRQIGVSETLIALLTAGAEWEELVVIIAALSQGRPALALGNVVGSSVSNIMGAFGLGLVFQSGYTLFDRSSKIYSAVLLGITSFLGLLVLLKQLNHVVGGLLAAGFVIYVGTVGYFIYRGVLDAPEDSDSDSDSDSNSDSDSDSGFASEVAASSTARSATIRTPRQDGRKKRNEQRRMRSSESSSRSPGRAESVDSTSERVKLLEAERSLLSDINPSRMMEEGLFLDNDDPLQPVPSHGPDERTSAIPRGSSSQPPRKHRKSIVSHICKLFIGLAALILSGYVLSEAAGNLAKQLGIVDGVLGATLLSLATTLPEKFTAVFSGSRGYSGILVANTVGSNVFLLTLCLGVILLSQTGSKNNIGGDTGRKENTSLAEHINVVELVAMWTSSVALTAIVFYGSRRWMGVLLLGGYITFLILEFVLYGRGGS